MIPARQERTYQMLHLLSIAIFIPALIAAIVPLMWIGAVVTDYGIAAGIVPLIGILLPAGIFMGMKYAAELKDQQRLVVANRVLAVAIAVPTIFYGLAYFR